MNMTRRYRLGFEDGSKHMLLKTLLVILKSKSKWNFIKNIFINSMIKKIKKGVIENAYGNAEDSTGH